MLFMGKSTISMVIFNSYVTCVLWVYNIDINYDNNGYNNGYILIICGYIMFYGHDA